MEEEWKRYRETNYEVSNLGEVRNFKTNNILKSHKKYNGKKDNDYKKVNVYIDGKMRKKSIHRMVAECFLNNYSEELEVNHKNGIRSDNRVGNLEMSTKEENYQHSLKYGNGSQRKPVCAIDDKGNRIEFKSIWAGARFIKDKFEIKREIDKLCTNIKSNINGKCKSAYGYRWEWGTNAKKL